MQVKVAPVSSTNLYGPCPLIFTGTMIAASFGGANSKFTSPGAVPAGTPRSFGDGMTQPDHDPNRTTRKRRTGQRIHRVSSQVRTNVCKGLRLGWCARSGGKPPFLTGEIILS